MPEELVYVSPIHGVLLGFEIGSGKPVYLPLHHLAIFGMTQKSGKTTALEALISRAKLKAIAFITKRGEGGFTNYNLMTPYYKPRSDWQFVEGLVNVALGEKVKYEPGMRSAIMKVCRGRKDLKEIQLEARSLAKSDRSQFMRAVYERLDQYLDIVIPELDKWTFTTKLELTEGINVMDLSGMRLETQHLVIASTIEYAFSTLDHVVVIIPEAWESIPQGKMTPVKWVAEQFIRKGAALGNYLFLDSQDIGGIDKTPLRQVDNWLLGRMKEAHEVERILKQLMGAKISAEEIQTLGLGTFYAAIGNDVKKVYVLPLGVPEEVGRQVALGQRSPESVREEFLKVKVMEEDEMYKQKYEELKRQVEEIRLSAFEEGQASLSKDLVADNKFLDGKVKTLEEKCRELSSEDAKLVDTLEVKTHELKGAKVFRDALTAFLFPEGLPLLRNAPEIGVMTPNGPSKLNVNVEQPLLTLHREHKELDLDPKDLEGKIAIVYADHKLPDDWFTTTAVLNAFRSQGWEVQDPRLRPTLDKFCQWGFFEKHLAGQRPEYRVRMKPEVAREKGLLKEAV